MNATWQLIFLGAIAIATVAIAVVQVGVVVYAGRLARRLERIASCVERDIQPVLERVNSMSGDAARATALAVAQMERADRVFQDLAQRLEELSRLIQQVVEVPAREGAAIVRALRAGLAALRGRSDAQATPAEEENALFIG